MTCLLVCLLAQETDVEPLKPEPELAVERLAPAILDDQRRDELHGYIMGVAEERLESFLPSQGRFMVYQRGALPEWDATRACRPVVEYVTMIVEDQVLDPTGVVETVAVYWFRPNPEPKKYGVTVRRVFRFAKDGQEGGLVGVEYWFHYPTPLSPVEVNYALRKAPESAEALAFMRRYTGDPDFDFADFDFDKQKRFERRAEIDPLIAAREIGGRVPGDRVAVVSYRDTFTKNEVHVSVNVTQRKLISPEDLKR